MPIATIAPDIGAVLQANAPDVRAALMSLRALIIRAADETPAIGPLEESLKWGQPAYRPKRPRTGTTIRIAALKDPADHYAVFFHCQSGLIPRFRELYARRLSFQGNRAIVFTLGADRDDEALRHCVSMALAHHLTSKSRTKASQGR